MPALVDAHMLARLAALPGADGRNLATELVDAYLVAAPRALESLERALEADDVPAVRRGAHSLRGSALMLGASAFAELLHAVELSAERHDPSAASAALARAVASWPATRDALSAATAGWRDALGAG